MEESIETPCLFVNYIKPGTQTVGEWIIPEMSELTQTQYKKFKENVREHFGITGDFCFKEFTDTNSGYKKWILDTLLGSETVVFCTVEPIEVVAAAKPVKNEPVIKKTFEIVAKEGWVVKECVEEKIWTTETKEILISSTMHPNITEPPGLFLGHIYRIRGELDTDRVTWITVPDRGKPTLMRMVWRKKSIPKLVTTIMHMIPQKSETTMSNYEKGKEVSTIGYIFDQKFKHGPAKYYTPLGNIGIECEYHADRLHGDYTDHIHHITHQYKKGVLHGVSCYYGPLGETLIRSEEYIDGKMVAQWKMAGPNGPWIYWESLLDKFPPPTTIIKVGEEVIIPVGEPIAQNLSLIENDVIGGLVTKAQVHETYRKRLYDSNGLFLSDTCYKRNKLHGIRKEMYPGSSQVQIIEEYKDGVLHGLKREWYCSNGKQKMCAEYKDGEIVGNHLVWHEAGHLHMKVTHNADGKMHGEQIIYAAETLKVRLRLDSIADETAAESIERTKIGLLSFKQFEAPVVVRHAQYNNGVIVGTCKEWYASTKRKKMFLYNNLGEEVMTDIADYTLPGNKYGWYELSFNDKTVYQNMCDCIGEFFIYDGELKTFLPTL